MTAELSEGIPPPLDDDVDDVGWALSTAQVQWKRGAYADAIVWLRRAIESAIEAGNTHRASDLSDAARRLTEQMLSHASDAPAPNDVPRPVSDAGAIDELLSGVQSDAEPDSGVQLTLPDISDTERKLTPAPSVLPPGAPSAPPPRVSDQPSRHASSAPATTPATASEELGEERVSAVPISVEPAEISSVHPGSPPPRAPPPRPQPPGAAAKGSPSRRLPAPPRPPTRPPIGAPPPSPPPPKPATPLSSPPAPAVQKVRSEPAPKAQPSSRPAPKSAPPAPVEEPAARRRWPIPAIPPPAAEPAAQPDPLLAHAPEPEPEPTHEEVPAPLPSFPLEASSAEASSSPISQAIAEALEPPHEPVAPTEAPPHRAAPTEPPPAGQGLGGFSLADVRALQDLPEDAQAELAGQARLERLKRGQELASFSVALVLDGSVKVMPAIADVGCARVGAGELVCTTGSVSDVVELSVIAGQDDTLVAVWDAAMIEQATADCPWVADDLRAVADRFQALAGVTMGAMGDRLDESLRSMVTERCEVRSLAPGELLVEKGKPVPGLHIVGVGRIEIVDGDGNGVEDELGPGDFLFTAQVLGGGDAPLSARAGKGGALILFAPRPIAHELLVSVPPLLEILAS